MATNLFEAVTAIGTALADLSKEDQQKVIDGVVVLLGLNRTTSSSQGTGERAGGESGKASQDGGGRGSGKKLSIVEFMQQSKPATNPQRIAVFAAYRQSVEGVENFSRADLEGYFAKAKLPAPGKNYSRDYNLAVSEGWIHDDEASSYLTQSGESVVNAGFAGRAKPRGKAVAKKHAAKEKPET
jgi:hypothetical protein